MTAVTVLRWLVLVWLAGGRAASQPQVESVECLRHIARYQTALAGGQLWALQMFDSATKLPDGLLRGALVHLGHYDECVDLEVPAAGAGVGGGAFRGQYCRVVFSSGGVAEGLPEHQLIDTLRDNALVNHLHNKSSGGGVSLPLQWSVCAPSSCGPDGVARVAQLNLALLSGGLLVAPAATTPASCFFYGDPARAFDAADWTAVGVMALLLLVVSASTTYEYLAQHKEGCRIQAAVTSFSLRTNLRQLFAKARPGSSLTCLDGVRVLSMAWIILGHRYTLHSYMPSSNFLDLFTKFIRHCSNMVVLNGFLAVDSFFFLSGLLLAYVVCNDSRRGRVLGITGVPALYLYRYLRLTAPLAVVVLLSATVVDHASHGPMWGLFVSQSVVEACRTNWWATLLYVNNYVTGNALCVGQTWYLSVDMQLFWLSPLLLLPLVRWPRPSLFAILVLTLASAAATFGVTYVHEISWTFSALNNIQQAVDFSSYVYVNTPMRASPYLVGVALGHVLSEAKVTPRSLPRWSVVAGWAASAGGCLAVLFTLTIPYQEDFQYDRLSAAFYAALHRPAWALGLAWLVLACSTGHGGPVNWILSWRVWQPLSKLTYCAFLIHLTMMFMEGGTWRNPRHFSNFEVVHGFLGDLLLLALPTLALYLAVEAPTNTLLRMVFSKGSPRAPKQEVESGKPLEQETSKTA